jgi:hypothetical protein
MIALCLFLLWAALAYTPALGKKRLTAGKAEIVIARQGVRIKITTTEITFQESRHAQRSAAQQPRKEEAQAAQARRAGRSGDTHTLEEMNQA